MNVDVQISSGNHNDNENNVGASRGQPTVGRSSADHQPLDAIDPDESRLTIDPAIAIQSYKTLEDLCKSVGLQRKPPAESMAPSRSVPSMNRAPNMSMISLKQFLGCLTNSFELTKYLLSKRNLTSTDNLSVRELKVIADDKRMQALRTFFAITNPELFSKRKRKGRKRLAQPMSVAAVVNLANLEAYRDGMRSQGYRANTQRTQFFGLIGILEYVGRMIRAVAIPDLAERVRDSQVEAAKSTLRDYANSVAVDARADAAKNSNIDYCRSKNQYLPEMELKYMVLNATRLLDLLHTHVANQIKPWADMVAAVAESDGPEKQQMDLIHCAERRMQDFADVLAFAAFVSVPAQRRQIFAELTLTNLERRREQFFINVRHEKNSWTKLRRRNTTVERTIPLPTWITPALAYWLDQGRQFYMQLFKIDSRTTNLVFASRSESGSFGNFSSRFKKVAKALTTVALSPLAIRKLRATYFTKKVYEQSKTKQQDWTSSTSTHMPWGTRATRSSSPTSCEATKSKTRPSSTSLT
jgi:hypothetical protein